MKDQINNNKKLGRGLSALIGNSAHVNKPSPIISDLNGEVIEMIDIAKIVSGVYQPRKHFKHNELNDLSESIKENGVIQPIIVRRAHDVKEIYEIIAGERRYRASKQAGLKTVPAIIKELNNNQALEFAIVENVQRSDLSAIEEANGYRQLMSEFNYTQDQVAKKVGHSRSRIANLLRLLSLPKEVQDMIDKGQISVGHAKIIIGHDNSLELAHKVTDESLSVRDLEELVGIKIASDKSHKPTAKVSKRTLKNQAFKELEGSFSKIVEDLKVKINYDNKKQKGKITIFYNDLHQIEKLIKKFS
jgi:ParB family chromosome partitioning protein